MHILTKSPWGFLVFLLVCLTTHTFAQPNDCEGAEVICDNGDITYTPLGPGNDDLDANTFTTCGTGEHQSAWYYFEFDNSMPAGSILEFEILPNVPDDDYDFAVWGPSTASDPLQCGNLGSSIRCDFFIPSGDGGTGLEEGAVGGGFQPALVVNPGEGYYLLVDNFDNTSTGFTLSWSGSAATFLDCDATPPCEITVEAGADTTICNSETLQLNAAVTGGMGSETYEWTADPAGALSFLSDASITNPVLDGAGNSGTFVFTLTVSEGTCTQSDDVAITLLLDTDPTFNDLTLCETDAPLTLPTTSNEGITGTWDTPVIDPAGQGGTTISANFTPDPGQMVCTTATEVMIPVLEATDPAFSFPTELCTSDPTFFFPNTSDNGIDGTWLPSSITPSDIPGQTITATFSPNSGQCASAVDIDVTVNAGTLPEFDPAGPLCELDPPMTLPTVSLGGITGTWDTPVIDPAGQGGMTVTVEFTPDPGQGNCILTTTLDVAIEDAQEPVIDPVTLCELDDPYTLPTTSTNGISGTWSVPVADPAGQGGGTISSTFTPDTGPGDCIATTTLDIPVSASETPAFTLPAMLCQSDLPLALPTTSDNGISGTWTPAVIDPAGQAGNTIDATFTPDASFCAEEEQVSITVESSVIPQFDPVLDLCELDAPVTLPTTSLEGITGMWDIPVLDPTGLGGTIVDLTFTPDPGQGPCILEQTMSVPVEDATIPQFDPVGPLCELEDPVALPVTSLEGVTGTWDIPVIDPAGQGGTNITATFTADAGAGSCIAEAQIVVQVTEAISADFNIPASLCEDDELLILPANSTNGISGSWTPAAIDPAGQGGTVITALFVPDPGFCAAEVTVDVEIEEGTTPFFDSPGVLCAFDPPLTLPVTSLNGIEGSWDVPVVNPADYAGTTATFTFTPDPGQGSCIAQATISVEVEDGESPVFDPVGPLCEADNPVTLPTTSVNGVPGEWDIAVIDPDGMGGTEVTATFTPQDGTCASVEVLQVEIVDLPEIVSIDATQPTDCANANGSITVVADGVDLEYSIDGGVIWQTSNSFSGLGGGLYDIFVRPQGSDFCSASDNILLSTAESPVLDEVIRTGPTDCGGTDGTIEIIASGDDLEYSIDGGATWQSGNIFVDLTAGAYQIAIRPAMSTGCQTTTTIQLNDPQPASVTTVLSENPGDCGVNDGSITVNAMGGPLEFSIDAGATWQQENSFADLSAGDYQIVVRPAGALSCADTASVTLVAPLPPQIDSLSADPLNDCGAEDGQISVFTGTTGLEYSIDDGMSWQSSSLFTGLGAGQYTVLVRRANAQACVTTGEIAIDAPGAPQITDLAAQDPSDCGAVDGRIEINAIGDDLEYSLDDGATWQTDSTFAGLDAGSYTVLVRPASSPSCSTSQNVTLQSPEAPVIEQLLTTDITDCGSEDGTIAIEASGDSLEYSVDGGANWQLSGIFTGLTAGTYSITVRPVGVEDCIATGEATLIAPSPPAIEVEVSDLTDCGADDGRIAITTQDSALEYSIDGSTWQADNIFTDLPAGEYTVFARTLGTTNCVTMDQATIAALSPPQIERVIPTEISDCNLSDGRVEITYLASKPVEFSLNQSPWQDENVFDNLGPGDYRVLVRNVNSVMCLDSASFALVNPDCECGGVMAVAQAEPVTCFESVDGAAEITGVDGISDYNVLWDNGTIGLRAEGLPAGWIAFTISYNSDCTFRDSVLIDSPEPMEYMIQLTDTDCPGTDNGIIEVSSVQGGTGMKEFSLDGVDYQLSSVFQGLAPDVYDLHIRDANQCTHIIELQISEGMPVEVDLPDDVQIELGDTVLITPEVTAFDSFAWTPAAGILNPGELDITASPTRTTTYVLTVFNGTCSAQDDITVEVDVDANVYIPNVFSPNGDGINDAFAIAGDPTVIERVDRFTIFDRWGDVVHNARDFSIDNPSAAWDGTWDGRSLQPGVFVYAVRATLNDGTQLIRKGSVTLVR